MKEKITFLTAAALCFAACSNDENIGMGDGPIAVQITAGLSSPATRAIGSSWNGDRIGVMVTAAPNSDMEDLYMNVQYSTSSTGTTADFSAVATGIFFQDASETVTFSSYAPYQSSTDNATLPGTNGVVTVNTQTNNTSALQESIDFLFAEGATASKQSPTVTFTDNTASGGSDCSFHHKMAQLNVAFQVSDNGGFTDNQIFDATFNLGGLIHEGTFDVTTGKTTTTGTAVDSWDITNCNYTDVTDTRTYSLILLPQDLSTAPLTVSVGIDGQTYYNRRTINPNLEAGKAYTYTITVTKTGLEVSGCTITPWGSGSTGAGVAEM